MSSLNIVCVICSEYFKNCDIIYSTHCGHVFHKSCLFRWLNSSSSCPQCRRHCSSHLCHRLYVNFVEATPEDNEMDIEYPKSCNWIYADKEMDFTEDMSFGFMFGWDEDGCDIYAARGRLNGDVIPGYYIATKGEVVVSLESESHFLTQDIEILDISNDDAEYKWVPSSNGNIPENAFATGITASGDAIYTARGNHDGKMLYGKLQQKFLQAFMPYEDAEVAIGDYEVLVRIPRELTTPDPIESKEIKEI